MTKPHDFTDTLESARNKKSRTAIWTVPALPRLNID